MKEYVLGTSDHELARLELQQEVWGEITAGFLDRLELGPGARVLDVGCGPGLLLDAFQQRVGSGGSILAVDESERWCEHVQELVARRGWKNVEVVRSAVQELDPEAGACDVIFMRWVLGFLDDPEAILRRLVPCLAPGGRLALMDYNHEGVSLFPESEGFRAAVRATRALYASRGGDPWILGRVPELFRRVGLEAHTFEPYVIAGGPGSPAFRWADAFFPFHVEHMAAGGLLSDEERRTFQEEWAQRRANPDAVFFSPIVVGAAGRRPLTP